MINITVPLLVLVATTIVLHVYSVRLAKTAWIKEERRYTYMIEPVAQRHTDNHQETINFFGKARNIAWVSALVMGLASFGFFFASDGLSDLEAVVASGLTIMAWTGGFVLYTDIKTARMPMELADISNIGAAILAAWGIFAVLGVENISWGDIALWVSVLAIFFTIAIFGGAGMGDVVFMVLATLVLGWWVPGLFAYAAIFIASFTGLMMNGIQWARKGSETKEARSKYKKSFLKSGKPPVIKIIEEAMDKGKATDEQIQEWKEWKNVNITHVPMLPHYFLAYVIVTVIALYI